MARAPLVHNSKQVGFQMSEAERLKQVREAEHREAKWDDWAHKHADALEIESRIWDELRVEGKSIESLAGKLQCSPEHLERLLGSPAQRPIPVDDDVNLWADEEKLESVL